VLQFWWNFELTKFGQNFGATFGVTFGNGSSQSKFAALPPPKKKGWQIRYYALQYFHFCKNLKLQFWPKFWILWQNYRKIQSLGPKLSLKYWGNFRCRNTSYESYDLWPLSMDWHRHLAHERYCHWLIQWYHKIKGSTSYDTGWSISLQLTHKFQHWSILFWHFSIMKYKKIMYYVIYVSLQ